MSEAADTEPSEVMSNMFATVWVKVEVKDDDETPLDLKDDCPDEKGVMGTDQGEIYPAAETETSPSHTKLNKPTKLLYCNHCYYSGTSKKELRKHLATHNASFKCDQCNYTSKHQFTLQKHISKIHQAPESNQMYSCDMCDYKSRYKGNIILHQRKHSKEKKYKCDKCDYKTSYRNNYDKHAKTHKDKVTYKCDKCPFEAQFLGKVQRHLAEMHNEVFRDKYTCERCGFSKKERWKLTKHTKRSETSRPLSCEFCNYKTNFKCEFRKHKHSHTIKHCGHQVGGAIDKKDCEQCQAEAQAKMQLQNHLKQARNVEPTVYKCVHCDYISTENWRLNIHKQKSVLDSQSSCSYCEFTSNYRCEMKKHKYTFHYSEIYGNGRVMDCSKWKDRVKEMINMQSDEGANLESINAVEMVEDESCTNKEVKNLVNVQTNVYNESVNLEQSIAENYNSFNNFNEASTAEIKAEITNYPNDMHKPQKVESAKPANNEFKHCQSNNYIIDTKCVAWHSIQVIETDDGDKPFRCKLCDYNSRFKASVQRHYQRHHMGEMNRPYKCLNCDFSTKTKDQITLHNKRSLSTVDLMCESCDFITTFKCSLIYHQKSHYKYKCNICSYSCKLNNDLTKHFATFHLRNGLKCQYCDFTAIRKDSILSHESIHTGQKPYKCKLCNYTSVRKYLLDLHVKRHHDLHNVYISEVAQSSWVNEESTMQVV